VKRAAICWCISQYATRRTSLGDAPEGKQEINKGVLTALVFSVDILWILTTPVLLLEIFWNLKKKGKVIPVLN
jgi:hypothetical protein